MDSHIDDGCSFLLKDQPLTSQSELDPINTYLTEKVDSEEEEIIVKKVDSEQIESCNVKDTTNSNKPLDSAKVGQANPKPGRRPLIMNTKLSYHLFYSLSFFSFMFSRS